MLRRVATISLLLLLVSFAIPVRAPADSCLGIGVRIEPFAHEVLTVADSAIGFTPATIAGAIYAYVTVEAAPLRWFAHGTDPTSTTGHRVQASSTTDRSFELCGAPALAAFKAIRTTGSSATLRATFFRWDQ